MAKRKERIILQTDTTKIEGYELAGTLDDWRVLVSRVCAGNHRLVLAISTSFAAPLLHHLDQQGFGINFRGASSIGKTTLLRVAKSVMGDHAHISTWRSTSAAIESKAAQHNDSMLPLDEMGEADPKDIGATAYMLANGQGKQRLTRNITLRPALSWRLIFLSTGEITLADALAQVRQKIKAGQAVRIIDSSADAGAGLGIFDQLPEGFSNGAEFADCLKDTTKQHHGHAFIEYLTQLTGDLPTHMQTVRDFRSDWLRQYLPKGSDSQVRRVADSFATIAAGGELATDFNITGWVEGGAGESAAVCFNAWVKQRGGIGNQEQADILNHIQNHFQEHGSAKYAHVSVRPQDDKTMYRMGFRDDSGDFYVLPNRFESELCHGAGFDKKEVVNLLLEQGYLHKAADDRPTISKYFFNLDDVDKKKQYRVYHIDSSVMGGGA